MYLIKKYMKSIRDYAHHKLLRYVREKFFARIFLCYKVEILNKFRINKVYVERVGNLTLISISNLSNKEMVEAIRLYKKYKCKRAAETVVYSALDVRDTQLQLPEYIVLEWDYVLFSERKIEGVSPFEIRSLKFEGGDPAFKMNFYKINPHLILQSYRFSLWIDPLLKLNKKELTVLIKKIRENGISFILAKSPSQSLSEELERCRYDKGENLYFVTKNLLEYKGFESFEIFDTNIVYRNNQKDELKHFNNKWWGKYTEGILGENFSCLYTLNKLSVSFAKIDLPKNFDGLRQSSIPVDDKAHLYVEKKPCINNRYISFNYNKKQNAYSMRNVPYRVKRAFINAEKLNFYDSGMCELKVLFEQGDTKERSWASWFIVLLYLNGFDQDSESTILHYLDFCDLNSIIEGGADLISFLKNELAIRNSKPPLYENNKNDDITIQFLNAANSPTQKINFLNDIFEKYGLCKLKLTSANDSFFERILPEVTIKKSQCALDAPKVSIIVPCYNCSDQIESTLYTLINQTWLNIEILLVDDCSDDRNLTLLRQFERIDSRISVIAKTVNTGLYDSRNVGLSLAKGKYITVCLPGDWCHPQKIQFQARQLEEQDNLVANCTSWIKCDSNFFFYRNVQPYYSEVNLSSLMFLRDEVIDKLGEWDNVLFSADREFYKRLIKVFGKRRVCELAAITTIGRIERPLTLDIKKTHCKDFPYVAKLEYIQNYEYWHKSIGISELKYCCEQTDRRFPAPRPLLEKDLHEVKHYDYIFAGDLREKVSADIIKELIYKAQRNGFNWSVVQLNRPDVDARKDVQNSLRSVLHELGRSLTVQGEKVSCVTLQIIGADCFSITPTYAPYITTREIEYITKSNDKSISSYDKIFSELFRYKNSSVKTIYPDESLTDHKYSNIKSTYLYPRILQLKMSEIQNQKLEVSPLVTVVMPCIDEGLGQRAAHILSSRAGCDATIIIAMDDTKSGFISTLNKVARSSDSRFITYVAQDAFPGREWLKIAIESIETNRAGLLAFNDGKWFGRIASFGLVRKSWIENFYDKEILYSHYKSHKADNEITVLAKLDNSFVYNSDSTLIEVDYNKDKGGSNPTDDEKFKQRFNSQFGGKFPRAAVEELRKEYRVKVD
ncbi:glycosyltransferase family 2 protein [Salinimonas chungwhensis]|uniref:glycosyltransferase family 2 protein n=1 Tax=Salinimonas chungwhensis TaxID=265425 RepID=UPI0003601BBF|nr:glycosyltransferase family A protein [Salinimonas chungwhensis]